jgi:hypothetical protein
VLADIVRATLVAEHSKDVRFPARPDAGWNPKFLGKSCTYCKSMYRSEGAQRLGEEVAAQRQSQGIQSAIKKRHPRPSATDHKAPVEMEEKEPKPKSSIQYILERLSEILQQDENADADTSFLSTPTEIDASPEEGARLIHAFIRIKQPELRAAIIKLTTQMAEVKTLK